MKKLNTFLAILIVVLTGIIFSKTMYSQAYTLTTQTNAGNPGGLNTENDQVPGSGWTQLLTYNQVNSPKYTNVQTMPFSFNFNGSAVNQFIVASTGYLTFDVSVQSSAAASASSAAALPSSLLPPKSVCAWGILLQNSSSIFTGDISTKIFGTAPNRQLWVAFNSLINPNGSGSYSFCYWAIVLEETTNKIYIVNRYGTNFSGTFQSPLMSIGIQINSTTAVQIPSNPGNPAHNTNSAYSDNDYYTFTPATGTGIREAHLNETRVELYPNPASDKVNIRIDQGFDKISCKIFNSCGLLVSSYTNINDINTINIENLAGGLYTILLESEEGWMLASKKLLVIH